MGRAENRRSSDDRKGEPGWRHDTVMHSFSTLDAIGRLRPVVCLAAFFLPVGGCTGPTSSSVNGSDQSPSVAAMEPQRSRAPSAKPSQPEADPHRHEPLSDFVRRIFQDTRGHLWFGTNGDGVARYDGDALEYFSLDEGFGGVAVRAIVEDKESNLWFGTENGLTRYDGNSFVNFAKKDGLVGDNVWSLLVDHEGLLWIGTLEGVSRFDGTRFSGFTLPEAAVDPNRGVSTAKAVHAIMEDREGKIWFGTSGGAQIYSNGALTSLSAKDGLCGDSVNAILQARDGNIWFATHHNGVCRFDGESFSHFSAKDGVEGTEAWDLYEDKSGNIWFPIENSGVYRFDGQSFANFQEPQGLTTNAVQSTFEDREGRLWLGGWKGLFRHDGTMVVAVGKNGPWKS